ncbi:VanZ family protein [Actinomadura flavalba]|uniref:VanZ family protein n=1 Tax=Actinomadura flavalba TaxID=1120938 RepID=UPI000476A392|nr:VanZ family protein [Actinomadura flavalba]
MTTTETRQDAPVTQREPKPWYVTVFRVLAVLVALAGLVVFFYYAFKLTLTPVNDNGQAGGNTDPGRSLRFYLDRPTKEAIFQLGGNLVLLSPLGVLLPIASRRLRGPVRLLLIGGLVSLVIETTQGLLVMGRAFDVDDVMLNTLGVVLAYLLVGRKLSHVLRGRRR